METHSGIAFTFEELDQFIGPWRHQHVYNAAYLPPHISLFFPWKTPPVDNPCIKTLKNVLEEFEPFKVRFRTFGRFGNDVLYLVPEDHGQISKLHRKLTQCFEASRDLLPFTPHLTVAFKPKISLDTIQEDMKRELKGCLPIEVKAKDVSLFYGSISGSWRRVGRFCLGTEQAAGVDADR